LKGLLPDDTSKFLEELHQVRDFEIFTAIESQVENGASIRTYQVSIDYQGNGDHIQLPDLDADRRGIWFTANSMHYGKRKIEFISSFNAMALDMDAGKEGDDRELIERGKREKNRLLQNLQLPPTVIVETKNGLQAYWLLYSDEIKDNAEYVSLQQMMCKKLGGDPGAIGGERLYRLPGFNHWKNPDEPFMVRIVHTDYSKRYSLKELLHKYGGQKKHKKLAKKNVNLKYSGKPIELEKFDKDGDITNIAIACKAFERMEVNKAPSHRERLAMLSVYANLGRDGLEHFRSIALNWNDYNDAMTEYMIKHTVQRGYKPMTCQYMIQNGLCSGHCANIIDKHSPIAFYFNSTPTLPDRFKERQYLDAKALPMKIEYRKIQNKVEEKLKEHEQSISNQHKEIFQTAAAIMSYRPPDEKPIVMPFIPGGGKTTFIIEYLRYMTSIDKNFGAVLVVERQDTIREIASQINGYIINGEKWTLFGTDIAYPMIGFAEWDCQMGHHFYKPSLCKTCNVPFNECRVKYNFTYQKRLPIVIISHARLFEMSDRDDALSSLRYWEESIQVGPDEFEKVKHPRRLLIMDEKPKLVDNVATDNNMWDEFIADVLQFTPDYANEVQKAVRLVRNNYAKADEYDIVPPVDEGFKWSKEFIEEWRDHYLGDHPEYPELLRRVITEGGLYSREANAVCLTHYSNTYWGDYNAVILDGTAMTDPDYRNDRFLFWDVPHLRPYHNLTIHVCMEQNLSKTYYKEHEEFIGQFCNDIKEIAKQGKTYLVAYKGYESEFEQRLRGNEEIRLEHWGNTKGRNDLKDCQNIVCAGLLHKGETYYHSKDIALYGVRDDERSFSSNTIGRVRRFTDLNTESTKVYEFITELIQDIFRTGLRNHYSDEEIHVYLCTRDPNLINLLQDFFTGCIVDRDWKPKALLGDREAFREFVKDYAGEYGTNAKLVKAFLAEGNDLITEDVAEVLQTNKHEAARMLRRIQNNQ